MCRLLAVFLGLFFLTSCSVSRPGTPEEAFDTLVSSIEEKDIERLDAILAEDFVGDADRVTTMSIAHQAFRRSSTPRIKVLSQEKQDGANRVTFRTKMLIVSGRGVFPRHSARLQVDTQWQKTDQGWKLRVAQWHRL